MATKTISLKIEAWERSRRARRTPGESFSSVVMRARWPEVGITGGELASGPRPEERESWERLVERFRVLVTRDARHFRRVPGLSVLSYGSGA